MTTADLDILIQQGEGVTLEFKESLSSSFAREVVALANTVGGKILLVWCLTNTLMKMRGHFGRRQGAMTSSGGYHARKSNAADGQKDPQIRKRICETPH